MADGGAEGYTEHERSGPPAAGDGDRATELVLGHEVRRVGADHGPEEAVREPADHASADEHLVGGSERREHVRDGEDHEHHDDEGLAGVAARKHAERRGAQHDGASEYRDEQADLGFGDPELCGDIRKQTGRKELAGHRREDQCGEGEQARPGKSG